MLTENQRVHIRIGVLTDWIIWHMDKYNATPTAKDALDCAHLEGLLRGTERWGTSSPFARLENSFEPIQNDDDIRFVVEKTAEWITIKREYQQSGPHVGDPSHSALLARLLSGKKPFPVPPPVINASPRYDLAEGKAVRVTVRTFDDRRVAVDNSWDFVWENESEGILRHVPSGDLYRLRKNYLKKISR